MATKTYTIRKYDGDDRYSWAVFRSADVKGLGSVIFYGDAKPLCTGMSKSEAEWRRDTFEQEPAGNRLTALL